MSGARSWLSGGAVLLAGLGTLACATQKSSPPPPVAPAVAPVAAPDAAPELPAPGCPSRPAPDEVRRAAVVATVDGGLGQWLRGVEIEPALIRHRFRGWIVRSLYPGDVCYEGVGLQPGDVVSKINGKPIERPEEAATVFQSLKTADEIVVDYERDGAPGTLRFRIVP